MEIKNKMLKLGIILILYNTFSLSAMSYTCKCSNAPFVKVRDGQFIRDGKPYYFIGANFWYATILASTTDVGNRPKLLRELDNLKDHGINNLRILVGAESGSRNALSVQPVLQDENGKLDDRLLDGLDFLIAEMGKRDMVGVFYFSNSWDWSGGYGSYLRRAGFGDSPNATADGWVAYCEYAAQMNISAVAQDLFFEYISKIISRKNRYTNRLYAEEPAIMAWQIANEPRPFNMDYSDQMAQFIQKSARLIKSIDKNHLVSVGSEGIIGCQYDSILFDKISSDKNIDYITVHVWPRNWNWVSDTTLIEGLSHVYSETEHYLRQHYAVANKYKKPVVIEEFGYPRDDVKYLPGTPIEGRNRFYEFIFRIILENFKSNGIVAGCNFWGWSGEGRPTSITWTTSSDYLADPPHEPQGWYSVFDSDDMTMALISLFAKSLSTSD